MIARRLGLRFVDTDALIVDRMQMSISDIFEKLGEPKFREVERQVVAAVAALSSQVIATGGGVPISEVNVANLKRSGILFCLTASPEIIYKRTVRNRARPLLQVKDKLDAIRGLLESRRAYYAVADHQIDTSSRPASAVAREIVELYKTDADSPS